MAARIVFPVFVFLAAIAYGWVAWNYPAMTLRRGYGPGFFPLIIAALLASFAAIETGWQVAELVHRRGTTTNKSVKIDLGVNLRELTYTAILAISVVLAVLAMRPLGFVLASASLNFVMAIVMGTRSVWQALVFALITSGGIYLIFTKGFGVVLAF